MTFDVNNGCEKIVLFKIDVYNGWVGTLEVINMSMIAH